MGTPIYQNQTEIDQDLLAHRQYYDFLINQVINHRRLTDLERVQTFRFPAVPDEYVEVSHFSDTSPSTETSSARQWIDDFINGIYDESLSPNSPQSQDLLDIDRPQDLLDIDKPFDQIDNLLDDSIMVVSQRTAALAEESAEVELLFAQAQKFNEINKRLAVTQAKVMNLGRSLQEALGPVYSDTQSLQIVTDSELST